ncbi:MAG: tetratricopeptide repeat protein [Anaerolineales bacterium]
MTAEPSSLLSRALEAYQQGRLDEAIQLFEAAHASETDPAQAAELANNLSVAYLKAGLSQQALTIVRGTAEVFSKLGDSQRAAQATGNLAAALDSCGDFAHAEAAYQQAAEMFRGMGESESLRYTLNALAQLQLRQHRPLEAANTLQAGAQASPPRGLRGRLLKQLLRLPSRLLRP